MLVMSGPFKADAVGADVMDASRFGSSEYWDAAKKRSLDAQDPDRIIRLDESLRSAELKLLRSQILGKSKRNPLPEDVLFLVLCHVVAEPEARELAGSLLKRFKNVGKILAAREDQILKVCKGNEECVALLKSTHLLMRTALLASVEVRITINSVIAIYDYLKITIAHEVNEVFRILFLDANSVLIADILHSEGTVNHVPVYPREVIRSVLEHNAVAIVLVHNHPSGGLTPSPQDIAMTDLLQKALKSINVALYDHVIVTQDHCISMYHLGLI